MQIKINDADESKNEEAAVRAPRIAPDPAAAEPRRAPHVAPDPDAQPADSEEAAGEPVAEATQPATTGDFDDIVADLPDPEGGVSATAEPDVSSEQEASGEAGDIFDEFEDIDEEDTVPRADYDELKARFEELEAAHEALESEHATLANRYERFQSDWENYRRRTEENMVLEKANASKNLVKAILPPLDDFERAITHAQQSGADADVVSGMYAIYKKMINILAKEGVEQVRGKGEKFDIETQQAIERREGTDMEPDMVAEVYQTGYVMNGVVIRPALVAVTA